MKNAITIRKEIFSSLNAYTVEGSNGSRLYRSKNNYRFKDSIFSKDEYAVLGSVNGEIMYIECKDYKSARRLFDAMENR